MSIYSLPPLFSATLFAIFGTLVYNQNRHSKINQAYLYFCSTTFIWQGTWTFLFNINDPAIANIVIKIGYTAIIFLPISFYQFNISFLRPKAVPKMELALLHLAGLFFLITLWNGNYFIDGYYKHTWGFYPKAGVLHPIYLLLLSYLAIKLDYLLIRALLNAPTDPIQAAQLRYVFIANLTYTAAVVDFADNYGVNIYPVGVIAITLSISIIAYAILRHRLLDFNLLIRWGLASAIFTFFLFLSTLPVFWILEKISNHYFHVGTGATSVIVISLLVLIFDPLKIAITKFIDQILFKSTDLKMTLSAIEITIANATDLPMLTSGVANNLMTIWNTNHAGFLLWDYHQAMYQPFPQDLFSKNSSRPYRNAITKADFLIKTLETEKRLFWQGIVIEDEVTGLGIRSSAGERITFWKIRRTMRWIDANICIPVLSNSQLIGVVFLGKRINQSTYNNEDKKILSRISELLSPVISSFINVSPLEET